MKIRENSLILSAVTAVVVLMSLLGFLTVEARADEISFSHTSTDGSALSAVTDDDEYTYEPFDEGTEITISADEPIAGIYIKWEYVPGEWTLKVGDSEITCGTHDFLHEYIDIAGILIGDAKVETAESDDEEALQPDASAGSAYAKTLAEISSVTIVIPADNTYINDIYVFSEGELPSWVQVWEDPYEEADLLCIATHADDDILWFGPLMADLINRGNVRVQVAYFCEFYSTGQSYRHHELLEGLWTLGVTHYPQMGEFEDVDLSLAAEGGLAAAESSFDVDAATEYIVRTIRRFKPQVVVTHDLNGEYGHGTHMLTADLVCKAVDGITADESQYPESAEKYGVWDVPKTYLHLYDENQISIDVTEPLAVFGGETAVEVAESAYACHLSQQWTDFHVSTETDSAKWGYYERPCTEFGLYRTTVGEDTGNDVMENIITYDEQEAQNGEDSNESNYEPQSDSDASPHSDSEKSNSGKSSAWKWIVAAVAALVLFLILFVVIRAIQAKRRRARAARRRLRRREQTSDQNMAEASRRAVKAQRDTFGSSRVSSHSSRNARR